MGNPTSTQAVLITATSLAYFSVQFHFGAPPMPSYQPLPTCMHYSFLSSEQHSNLYILQGRDKTSIQPMPSAATRKSAYYMIKHTLIDDFQYVISEHHLSCDVGHGRFREARSQDVALSCLWRSGMLLAFTSPYVFSSRGTGRYHAHATPRSGRRCCLRSPSSNKIRYQHVPVPLQRLRTTAGSS